MVQISPLFPFHSPIPSTSLSNGQSTLQYYFEELQNTFQRAQCDTDLPSGHFSDFAEVLFQGVLSEKEGLHILFERTRFWNLLVEAADPETYHPLFHTALSFLLRVAQRLHTSDLSPSPSHPTPKPHAVPLHDAVPAFPTLALRLAKVSEALAKVLTRKDCFHLAISGLYLFHTVPDDQHPPAMHCSETTCDHVIDAMHFWNPLRRSGATTGHSPNAAVPDLISENGSAIAGLDACVAYEQLVLFVLTMYAHAQVAIPKWDPLFLAPSRLVEILVEAVADGQVRPASFFVHVLIHCASTPVVVQALDHYAVRQREESALVYTLPLLLWEWLLSFGIDHPDPMVATLSVEICRAAVFREPRPANLDACAFLQIALECTEVPAGTCLAELAPELLRCIPDTPLRLRAACTALHTPHEAVKHAVGKFLASNSPRVCAWHRLATAFEFDPDFLAAQTLVPSMENLEDMHDHVGYLLEHLDETWCATKRLKSLALLSKHPCYAETFAPYTTCIYDRWLRTTLLDPSIYLLQILYNCDHHLPQNQIKVTLLYSRASMEHLLELLSMECCTPMLRFQIAQLFTAPLAALDPISEVDQNVDVPPALAAEWQCKCLERFRQTYIQPLLVDPPDGHDAFLALIHTLRLLTTPPRSTQYLLTHPFTLTKYLGIVPGCTDDMECQASLIMFFARMLKRPEAQAHRQLIDDVFMHTLDTVLWPYLLQHNVTAPELTPLVQACLDFLETHAYDSRCMPFLEACLKADLWTPTALRCLLNKPEAQSLWLLTQLVAIFRREPKPSIVARHALALLLAQGTDESMLPAWLVHGTFHWVLERMDAGFPGVWRLLAHLVTGVTRRRLFLLYTELWERCVAALAFDGDAWFFFVQILAVHARALESDTDRTTWWAAGVRWLERPPHPNVHALVMRSWMHIAYDDPGALLRPAESLVCLKCFLAHPATPTARATAAVICALLARHSTHWMTQLAPELVLFIQAFDAPTEALLDFSLHFALLGPAAPESTNVLWLAPTCAAWLPWFTTQLQRSEVNTTLLILQLLVLATHHGLRLSEPAAWLPLLTPHLSRYPEHVAYLLFYGCTLASAHSAKALPLSALEQAILGNPRVRLTPALLTLLCAQHSSLRHSKVHAYLAANLTEPPLSLYTTIVQTSKDLVYWIDAIDLLGKLTQACLATPTIYLVDLLMYFASKKSGRLYLSQKRVASQFLKLIDKKGTKTKEIKLFLDLIERFSRHVELHSSVLYDVDILLDLTGQFYNYPTLWIIFRNLCFSKPGRIKLAAWIQHTLVRTLLDLQRTSAALYTVLQILWVYSYHEYSTTFRSFLGDKLILLRPKFGEHVPLVFENVAEHIIRDHELHQVQDTDLLFLIEVILESIDKGTSDT